MHSVMEQSRALDYGQGNAAAASDEALLELEAFYRMVVETTPVPIFVFDSEQILYVSDNAKSVFGVDASRLIGRCPEQVVRRAFSPTQVRFGTAQLERLFQRGPPSRKRRVVGQFTLRTGPTNEGRRDVILYVNGGRYRGRDVMVASCVDVSNQTRLERERDEMIQRLAHASTHDSLTGLANRGAFEAHVSRHLMRGGSGVLAILDLDNFKGINDVLGHNVGDRLLQVVAERLSTQLEEHDFLCRFAGDEFCMFLEGHETAISARVEAMLHSLTAPVALPQGLVRQITGSAGLVRAPAQGRDHATLMRRADLAMYAAKASGRNRMAWYEDAQEALVTEREHLAQDLRNALDTGQLFLAFQPIVAPDGAIRMVEALLRWDHPQRGLLMPGTFLPVTEASGMIPTVGEWVLHQALAACARWRSDGHDVAVSVNMHAQQVDRGDTAFLDLALATLEAFELPPQALQLELTEDAIIDALAPVIEGLSRLRKHGVHVAIDDFGCGQSSLGRLRSLPVDVAKIDQLFVRKVADEANEREFLSVIVDLCTVAGLGVVFEGVETTEQRDVLDWHREAAQQGYLHGRPMRESDLLVMLQRHAERLEQKTAQ